MTMLSSLICFDQDTCWDEEDGSTPKLNLHLLTTNRRELSPSAWLQFDSKNQEFVGIPLEEEVGREEYQLVSFIKFSPWGKINLILELDALTLILRGKMTYSQSLGILIG